MCDYLVVQCYFSNSFWKPFVAVWCVHARARQCDNHSESQSTNESMVATMDSWYHDDKTWVAVLFDDSQNAKYQWELLIKLCSRKSRKNRRIKSIKAEQWKRSKLRIHEKAHPEYVCYAPPQSIWRFLRKQEVSKRKWEKISEKREKRPGGVPFSGQECKQIKVLVIKSVREEVSGIFIHVEKST